MIPIQNRVLNHVIKKFKYDSDIHHRCDICGTHEVEDDDFFSLFNCDNGHTFCPSHLDYFVKTPMDDIRKYCEHVYPKWYDSHKKLKDEHFWRELQDYKRINQNYQSHRTEMITSIFCPICTGRIIYANPLANYLLEKYNLNRANLEQEIRSKFENFTNFNSQYAEFINQQESSNNGDESI